MMASIHKCHILYLGSFMLLELSLLLLLMLAFSQLLYYD